MSGSHKKKDVTPRRARESKTESSKPATKKVSEMLPGHVERRMVKCGKPGCRCSRGELHGPYFYHRTWGSGGHQTRYVRLADVAETARACAAYRELQSQLRVGRSAYKLLLARARELFGR